MRGGPPMLKRAFVTIFLGLALTACNSTSDQWKSTSPSFNGRFEQAKAVCNGRAANNFGVVQGGLLTRAITSDAVFKGCMAEQGFVQNAKP